MATSERKVRTAYTETPRWGPVFPLRGPYPGLLFLFFSRKAIKTLFRFSLLIFAAIATAQQYHSVLEVVYIQNGGQEIFRNFFPVRIYMV